MKKRIIKFTILLILLMVLPVVKVRANTIVNLTLGGPKVGESVTFNKKYNEVLENEYYEYSAVPYVTIDDNSNFSVDYTNTYWTVGLLDDVGYEEYSNPYSGTFEEDVWYYAYISISYDPKIISNDFEVKVNGEEPTDSAGMGCVGGENAICGFSFVMKIKATEDAHTV